MCRALNLIAREPPPCSDCILTALLVYQSDYKSCSSVAVCASCLPPLWASRNAEYRLRTDSLI